MAMVLSTSTARVLCTRPRLSSLTRSRLPVILTLRSNYIINGILTTLCLLALVTTMTTAESLDETAPTDIGGDYIPRGDDGDSSTHERAASVGQISINANCGDGVKGYFFRTAYSGTGGVYMTKIYFPYSAYSTITNPGTATVKFSNPTATLNYGAILVNGVGTSDVNCYGGGNCHTQWQLDNIQFFQSNSPSRLADSGRGRRLLTRGAARNANLDTEVRSATRPGNPCTEPCEGAPGSVGCEQCCRTVRHETPWRCGNETGSEDSAGCCHGEWAASCWDTPSEANFGHSCNMCQSFSSSATFVNMFYNRNLMFYVRTLTGDALTDDTALNIECNPMLGD